MERNCTITQKVRLKLLLTFIAVLIACATSLQPSPTFAMESSLDDEVIVSFEAGAMPSEIEAALEPISYRAIWFIGYENWNSDLGAFSEVYLLELEPIVQAEDVAAALAGAPSVAKALPNRYWRYEVAGKPISWCEGFYGCAWGRANISFVSDAAPEDIAQVLNSPFIESNSLTESASFGGRTYEVSLAGNTSVAQLIAEIGSLSAVERISPITTPTSDTEGWPQRYLVSIDKALSSSQADKLLGSVATRWEAVSFADDSADVYYALLKPDASARDFAASRHVVALEQDSDYGTAVGGRYICYTEGVDCQSRVLYVYAEDESAFKAVDAALPGSTHTATVRVSDELIRATCSLPEDISVARAHGITRTLPEVAFARPAFSGHASVYNETLNLFFYDAVRKVLRAGGLSEPLMRQPATPVPPMFDDRIYLPLP